MLDKLSDLHMHLNGSFSLDFLQKIAEKNAATLEFNTLLQLREQYIKQNTLTESIALIWEQFAQIHHILQSLDDVYEGTINAIASSTAHYMEIRTRPKEINNTSWEDYVAAFLQGLQYGNDHVKNKVALGILSLDRTKDTKEKAIHIIDRVAQEKTATGLLVGIDISGNPSGPRALTGDHLESVLEYALEKNIGTAIHLGEVESEVEHNDVNIILKVLNSWHTANDSPMKNPLHGKVRLGHGIYLTAAQRALIKQLQIPIEICPTCHEKVNWWNRNGLHPVTSIYTHWQDPVVSGTDDEIIFGANADEENQTVLTMLGYPATDNFSKARIHQAQFRFVGL
jgi:adenosine deaminase